MEGDAVAHGADQSRTVSRLRSMLSVRKRGEGFVREDFFDERLV